MYLEQTSAGAARRGQPARSGFAMVTAIPAAAFLSLIISLALSRAAAPDLMPLFAPGLAVCMFLVWREWTAGAGTIASRTGRLLSLIGPFAAGAATPVLAFVLWYWQQHAVTDLIRGVFILPQ